MQASDRAPNRASFVFDFEEKRDLIWRVYFGAMIAKITFCFTYYLFIRQQIYSRLIAAGTRYTNRHQHWKAVGLAGQSETLQERLAR